MLRQKPMNKVSFNISVKICYVPRKRQATRRARRDCQTKLDYVFVYKHKGFLILRLRQNLKHNWTKPDGRGAL